MSGGETLFGTGDNTFAGKKGEYSQATSQANACGNGELPLNMPKHRFSDSR